MVSSHPLTFFHLPCHGPNLEMVYWVRHQHNYNIPDYKYWPTPRPTGGEFSPQISKLQLRASHISALLSGCQWGFLYIVLVMLVSCGQQVGRTALIVSEQTEAFFVCVHGLASLFSIRSGTSPLPHVHHHQFPQDKKKHCWLIVRGPTNDSLRKNLTTTISLRHSNTQWQIWKPSACETR